MVPKKFEAMAMRSTQIFLDGSNILFWQGGHRNVVAPELVVRALLARRFQPTIYFDNSVERLMTSESLEQLSALAEVRIAPRGSQADGLLLSDCLQGRIQIVSNDRFSDWQRAHPRLCKEWLVTGTVGKGGRVSFSKKLRPAPL